MNLDNVYDIDRGFIGRVVTIKVTDTLNQTVPESFYTGVLAGMSRSGVGNAQQVHLAHLPAIHLKFGYVFSLTIH